MTPKKPEWFEMTEGQDASSGIRKVNKKLPFVALLAAGAIIAAGSIFASTHNEPSAVADTPTATQSAAASQPNNSQSAPAAVATSKSSSGLNSQSAPAPVATSKSTSGLSSLPAPTVSKVPQRGEGEGRDHREGGDGREGEHHDD